MSNAKYKGTWDGVPIKSGIDPLPDDEFPRERQDWALIAEDLMAHPGQWFLIFRQNKSSIVQAVRDGKCPAVAPKLGFRTATENNTRGQPRLCDLKMMFDPDRADPVAVSLHNAKGK